MALEDVIAKCIEAGVTHFELHEFLEGRDGDRCAFHWELYRGDPVKWVNIVMPWDLEVGWVGFRPHPKRPWGFMPIRITTWCSWRVGILTGGERGGIQTSERAPLEAGLRAALGNFLCEGWFKGHPCRHTICEFHGTEYCEPD